MSFLSEWSDWYTNCRFDWISKAKRDFSTHLQNPFTKQLVSSSTAKNVNLALFGKTQVGKTTLILKLMGIEAKYFEEIADLLRCGSEIGYSATPTAMIYRISNGAFFNVFQFNKSSCSFEEIKDLKYTEIKEILVQIRHKVESNQYDNSSALIIEIPCKYFSIQEDCIDLNIIDLPGLNSRSTHERDWTKELIKEFLPAANIVLVLDRGNQITGFLDLFDDEELNSITNWKYFPEKYRVITTYSYSAESIRNLFKQNVELTPEDLVKHYRSEIHHSLDKEECDDLIIYPIEYGESWDEFCCKSMQSNELMNIKEVNNYFFNQLIQDISVASSELNQISLLIQIGKVFQRRKIEFEGDLVKTQKACEEQLIQIDTKIENLQLVINDQTIKIKSINNAFSGMNNIVFNDSGFYNYSDAYDRDVMYNRINSIKTYVKQYISDFQNEMFHIVSKLKLRHATIINDEIDELINNCFLHIEDIVIGRFEDIFSDTISRLKTLWHSKSPRLDFFGILGPDKSHVRILNGAISTLNKYMKCVQKEVIKPNIGIIYDLLGQISHRQDLSRSKNESQKSELTRLKQTIADKFNNEMLEVRSNIAEINADIEWASQATESITDAHKYFIEECMQASSKSMGSKTLLYLLQAAQISKDYMSSTRISGRNNG